MRVIPIDKHSYKVFPILGDELTIEITDEQSQRILTKTMCFNDELNGVIEYVEVVPQEITQQRIAELKNLLRSSDYQAIKYAEGEITEEDYVPIRARRAAWRAEINQLEAEL